MMNKTLCYKQYIAKTPNINYEKSLFPSNCRYILGIDEVGRGPWAGPVTVAAFLLDLYSFDADFFYKNNIRDSKLLSPLQRQKAFTQIEQNNYSYSVISTDSNEIDKTGIQLVIIKSIYKLIKNFQGRFDFILIDGNLKLNETSPYQSVIKADSNCFSVAAASICAKVTRDQKMTEFNSVYPGYAFDHNKGYGTKDHLEGLKKLGPCPIHRFSYKPIKKFSSQ